MMHGAFYLPTFLRMCSAPVISLRYTHLRPLHLAMPALHISIPVSQGTYTSKRQGPVQVRCKCFAAPSTERCRLVWFLHPETPAGLSDSLGWRECGGTDIPTSEVRSEGGLQLQLGSSKHSSVQASHWGRRATPLSPQAVRCSSLCRGREGCEAMCGERSEGAPWARYRWPKPLPQ